MFGITVLGFLLMIVSEQLTMNASDSKISEALANLNKKKHIQSAAASAIGSFAKLVISKNSVKSESLMNRNISTFYSSLQKLRELRAYIFF